MTAHKSQGKTVDEVIISGDRMTRELFYVAASRGRKRITVFTADKENLREAIGVSGERMADVTIKGSGLLQLIRDAKRHRIDVLTVTPRHQSFPGGEGVVVTDLFIKEMK